MITDKIFKHLGLLVTNFAVLIVIIFLQFIGYATAPSINYDRAFKDNFDKEAACIERTINYNTTYVIEILIGGLILGGLNYIYLKKRTPNYLKPTIVLTVLYFFFAGLGLLYFTVDFIDRNMQMDW
jgi:hypothetical protein